MSIVHESGICHCSCHSGNGVRHCVPCCEPCPVCRKRLKNGSQSHVEQCAVRKWFPMMSKVPEENQIPCALELEAKAKELAGYAEAHPARTMQKELSTAFLAIARKWAAS